MNSLEGIRYMINKKWKSFNQQLDILEKRGLIVEDKVIVGVIIVVIVGVRAFDFLV